MLKMQPCQHPPKKRRRQDVTDHCAQGQRSIDENAYIRPRSSTLRFLDHVRLGSQVYARSLYEYLDMSPSYTQESEAIAQLKAIFILNLSTVRY